ncbi:5-bromo-4-chloroindolyl phosphate hydrolysis family protein [Alkalibacterium kapii]|uniref:5-bromo-4-chloroindolyl phosphate hydrolysis protein n=1 Tax=Alkalibacterium kapii TaxID=426704 RepID=A0A511AWQ3_9LACT|nr:5-bromo-4-chloroindolyl phosphate hydrolysis family protein [Alkalibacterium kapii]GEK91541.1 hypothetical protein AKA01nite_11630 [Alkalibacterium kapii]
MKRSNTRLNLIYALILFIIMFIFLLLVGFEINILVSFLLSIGIGIVMLNVMTNKTAVQTDQRLPRLSKEKEAFYLSKGLSKEDISYFRRTMSQAHQQIITIDENMNQSGKLKAIEHRNNTVSLAKELFKNITNEPDRLHDVDKFLYVHLPSLADLSKKYVEIESHKAKSKTTYDILQKSADTIDKMCEQIAEDYVRFKEDDIEDMSVEIESAKQSFSKDNTTSHSFDDTI